MCGTPVDTVPRSAQRSTARWWRRRRPGKRPENDDGRRRVIWGKRATGRPGQRDAAGERDDDGEDRRGKSDDRCRSRSRAAPGALCSAASRAFTSRRGAHRRPRLEVLHAVHHDHIAGLESLLGPASRLPMRGPICTSRCCALPSEVDDPDVILALQLLDGALRAARWRPPAAPPATCTRAKLPGV